MIQQAIQAQLSSVLAVAGVIILGLAAVLTLIRMSRGPSTLDRVVAADVMVAVVIAALAIEAVVNRHATTLPVILVLALVGFAGSLGVARFVADRDRTPTWGSSDGDADPDPDPDRQTDPSTEEERR